jgi:hypothetical protein
MDVPLGTKRLTLQVWDWFGVDCGTILDEVRPAEGDRTIQWDGLDDRGRVVSMGDYIVRLTADDRTASAIIAFGQPPAAMVAARKANTRIPAFAVMKPLRYRTVAALMQEKTHDLDWLKNALQIAIQLELATMPPYLTAWWTIKDPGDAVAGSIFEILLEEMSHLGIACNLLVAIGGTPLLADASVVPTYPGPLPGGVRPELKNVVLSKLTKTQAGVFMDIEYPKDGPIATALVANESFNSIGDFYQAIRDAFTNLAPPLSIDRQLARSGLVRFARLDTIAKVTAAIDLIMVQGEGSQATPEEAPGVLSHYYRFGEIFHEQKLILDALTNKWRFNGAPVPLPATWNMADIPEGCYKKADVTDMVTWELIDRFDTTYSEMLRKLQSAWTHGNAADIGSAIALMGALTSICSDLVQKPKPDGTGNYGPCFRYVP